MRCGKVSVMTSLLMLAEVIARGEAAHEHAVAASRLRLKNAVQGSPLLPGVAEGVAHDEREDLQRVRVRSAAGG